MKSFNPLNYSDAPEQISKSQFYDTSIEQVWDVVSNHQGMTAWVPMISHVDLKTPDSNGEWGEGCERNCKFGPDLLEETVVYWNPPYGYAYSIADMHLVRDHVAHIELKPEGKGVLVTWTQYFRPNGFAPKAWMAKNVMMPGVMSRALTNLGKKIKDGVLAKAATLLLMSVLLLSSCAADLRTRSIKDDAQTDQQVNSARQRLATAIAAQGMNNTDRFSTYEAVATDHWRGMLGNMGEIWPWKDGRMSMRYTLGDFDGQVEALEGKYKGFAAGQQSWDYYELTNGSYDTNVKDNKRIIFGLNAYHYFFEIGPRLLSAPIIRDYPAAELNGVETQRVFVSWGTEKSMDYDQYIVWIGTKSGLIEAVTYTVRDNYLPGAKPLFANIQFDDYREIEGVKIPFRQTVKMFQPDGKMDKGYVHQLTLEAFKWDAFEPEAIRPNTMIKPMGNEKPF